MNNIFLRVLFCFLLIGHVSKVSGEIIDSEVFKEEFGGHENYNDYVKFNETHDIGDYTFCELDYGEDLCLLGLKRQKYVIDLKSLDAKGISWAVNGRGELKPIGLFTLDEMEHQIFLFLARFVGNFSTPPDSSFEGPEFERRSLEHNKTLEFNSGKQLEVIVPDDNRLFNVSNLYNGCGTPDHSSYPYIPDFPFQTACNNHDICYVSFRNKSWCDSQFLSDMRNIADFLADAIAIDFPGPIKYPISRVTDTASPSAST